MKVHVRAVTFAEASRLVMDVMREKGGKWIVWHDAGFNYLMAPADSFIARGVRKYWSDVVAGEFDASVDRLAMRRLLERAYYGNTFSPAIDYTEMRKQQIRQYNRLYMQKRRAEQRAMACQKLTA